MEEISVDDERGYKEGGGGSVCVVLWHTTNIRFGFHVLSVPVLRGSFVSWTGLFGMFKSHLVLSSTVSPVLDFDFFYEHRVHLVSVLLKRIDPKSFYNSGQGVRTSVAKSSKSLPRVSSFGVGHGGNYFGPISLWGLKFQLSFNRFSYYEGLLPVEGL